MGRPASVAAAAQTAVWRSAWATEPRSEVNGPEAGEWPVVIANVNDYRGQTGDKPVHHNLAAWSSALRQPAVEASALG